MNVGRKEASTLLDECGLEMRLPALVREGRPGMSVGKAGFGEGFGANVASARTLNYPLGYVPYQKDCIVDVWATKHNKSFCCFCVPVVRIKGQDCKPLPEINCVKMSFGQVVCVLTPVMPEARCCKML